MKVKEIKKITEEVKRRLPNEHNWKLIEKVVRLTVKQMESRPWWKRLLNK